MCFLNKGLTITIADERPENVNDEGEPPTETFRFDITLIPTIEQ